jgi:hypothetical protein
LTVSIVLAKSPRVLGWSASGVPAAGATIFAQFFTICLMPGAEVSSEKAKRNG